MRQIERTEYSHTQCAFYPTPPTAWHAIIYHCVRAEQNRTEQKNEPHYSPRIQLSLYWHALDKDARDSAHSPMAACREQPWPHHKWINAVRLACLAAAKTATAARELSIIYLVCPASRPFAIHWSASKRHNCASVHTLRELRTRTPLAHRAAHALPSELIKQFRSYRLIFAIDRLVPSRSKSKYSCELRTNLLGHRANCALVPFNWFPYARPRIRCWPIVCLCFSRSRLDWILIIAFGLNKIQYIKYYIHNSYCHLTEMPVSILMHTINPIDFALLFLLMIIFSISITDFLHLNSWWICC